MEKALVRTLVVSVLLIVAAAYLHPLFKQPAVPPLAEWHMIDASQNGLLGDANLLLVGDTTVMIDAGLKSMAKISVVPYLRKTGIERINHFFITAPDRTYYEGLGEIIQAGIAVDNIYYRPVSFSAGLADDVAELFDLYLDYFRDQDVKMIEIGEGFSLDLPNNSSLTVIAEGRRYPAQDPVLAGDRALLIRFALPESSVLFSGDIGTVMSSRFAIAGGISADFLKMPYPHREDPVSRRFLNTVNPRFVLVPSAKRYWCEDVARIARNWTMDKEKPVWVTGTNGNIRVIWQARQVMILPQRQSRQCKLHEYGNMIVNY